MTCRLDAVRLAASDPARLARFWAEVLGWSVHDEPGGVVTLRPADGSGFGLRLTPGAAAKIGPNRAHLDLTSASFADQQLIVAHAIDHGAVPCDVGQTADEPHVVLADPEGNEFCVIEPGNAFLAGCGFVGAVACDGSEAVGRFWSAALDWPLVWDRDGETAVQSPAGGTKVSWGGPPVAPRRGPDRVGFDLVPDGGSIADEVDRLVALGASRVVPAADGDVALLADPDGTVFRMLGAVTPR